MKKLIWAIVIIVIWVLFFKIDQMRVEKVQKPWFCFPIEVSENGSGYYYGLGYKVHVTTKKAPNNKNVVDTVTMGHWFEDLKK